MEQQKPKQTHTVMPKKLAEALMEAGMQHFDVGGSVSGPFGGGTFGQLLGNNSYSASQPQITQQNFGSQIAVGQSQQDNAYQAQNNLAMQLLQQSKGQGPNIAQTQLASNTGNNVAAQGALMASQRGANANPALVARQAAMQGANTQQQAVGQAATLQAQQQMAAQGQLAGVQQSMAQEGLSQQGISQGAQASQNATLTQGQLGASNINANVSGQNAQQAGSVTGGLLDPGGAVMGKLYTGGEVKKMSDGGMTDNIATYSEAPIQLPSLNPFQLPGGKQKQSSGSKPTAAGDTESVGTDPGWEMGGGMAGGAGDAVGGAEGAGELEGLGSAAVMLASGGGKVPFSRALLNGGKVSGKPKVQGNSPDNDTQPTMLSPGEEVIDRETMQDPGPIGKAARMVAAHINKKGSSKAEEFVKHLKSNKKGYSKVLSAREDRKMCGGGKA